MVHVWKRAGSTHGEENPASPSIAQRGQSIGRLQILDLQRGAGNQEVVRFLQRCGPNRACGPCIEEAERQSAEEASVQRQPDAGTKDAGSQDAGTQDAGARDAGPPDAGAPAGSAVVYLTVRDREIGIGGQVVPDLEAVKSTIMRRQQTTGWTLVVAIHGSRDRLAAQQPPDWQKDAVFYDAQKIKAMFGGDPAYVTWRDKFGPQRVVILGCQVGATFEQVIADNMARGGSAARAQGLGEGCKPITRSIVVSWGPEGKEKPVTTRAEYARYSEDDRKGILQELSKLNAQWGYLGMPPVGFDDLLRFYFDEEPKGAWPVVEVNKDVNGSLTPLGVPYWNRMGNSTFLRSCSMGVGALPPRPGH